MCAYLRKLVVHSPGRKYTQSELASTLSSFFEQVQGKGKINNNNIINNITSNNASNNIIIKKESSVKERDWTKTIHSLFKNTKIETRSLLWDPAGITEARKAEDVMPSLISENTKIACQVVSDTLTACSLKPSDVDTVFFSSPLFSAPAMSVRAMNLLPFRRDVKHYPLMGLGCVGGVALISRASDYLRAYPKQTAVTLTVESGSRFWHGTLNNAFLKLLNQNHLDKEKIIQQILLAALFGDAISCTVMHGPESPFINNNINNNINEKRGPVVVDQLSFLLPDSVDLVSHHAEESGIQSYLSPHLGKYAPKAMADTVDQLLKNNNLSKNDISHWFVHAGGPKMLKYFEEEYGLKKNELRHCWSALAEVGNISSATVPRSYEIAVEKEKDGMKGWGVMVAAGPGLIIEVALLKWQ